MVLCTTGRGDEQAVSATHSQSRAQWRYIAAHVLTKLGDKAVDAKTVLTAVVQLTGAPTWISAMLVPIRESGSMLLQPLLGGLMRRLGADRLWMAGALGQAAAVALMALALWTLSGLRAGIAILLLVAMFAVARSACSLAGKQVLAEIADKGSRGGLSGRATSIAGALVLISAGVALFSPYPLREGVLVVLLLAAALAWVLAAALFPKRSSGSAGRSGPGGIARSVALLRSDRRLRRFVYSRGLLLTSSLSGPYFLLLDRRDGQLSTAQLASYVLAGALASMLSAPLWGRAADRSARLVMVGSGVFAALVVLVAAAMALQWLPLANNPYAYPLDFMLLALAHEGVRMGRKTYVVDAADDARQRAEYVATSNAGIGLLLLIVGALSAALASVSIGATLLCFAASGLIGALVSAALPEVSAE